MTARFLLKDKTDNWGRQSHCCVVSLRQSYTNDFFLHGHRDVVKQVDLPKKCGLVISREELDTCPIVALRWPCERKSRIQESERVF